MNNGNIDDQEHTDDLYEAFQTQVARKNHRSINSEVIYWLERAVEQRERDPEVILSNAQLVRGLWAFTQQMKKSMQQSMRAVRDRSRYEFIAHLFIASDLHGSSTGRLCVGTQIDRPNSLAE